MNGKVPSHVYTLINRKRTLEGLIETGRSKRELEADLDISRSTIDRSIQALEDEGLIDRAEFEPTPYGTLLYEKYLDFIETCRSIDAAKPVLTEGERAAQLPLCLFEDAYVVQSDKPNPQKPLMELSELVADARSVRLALPVVNSWYVQLLTELSQSESTVEIVLEEEVYCQFTSNFESEWASVDAAECVRIETTSDPVPFAVAILGEETVWVCLYNTRGLEIGGIVAENDDSLEWATNLLDSFETSPAERIELGDP